MIARQTGHREHELLLLRRSVELNPNDATARQDLGQTLMDRRAFDEAERHYLTAAALAPQSWTIQNDLAVLYRQQRRHEDSLRALDRAFQLGGATSTQPHFNRGQVLADLGKLAEALVEYEHALRLDPSNALAQVGRSRVLLLAGDLKRGFEAYEARLRAQPEFFPRLREPLWEGQDLTGKTIAVIAEQGVGDTIQFARYLPLLKERGTRQVIFICFPETKTLLQCLTGICVLSHGDTLPPLDFYVPLLSLPRLFGTTLKTVPSLAPYLQAEPQQVAVWKKRLEAEKRLKVGLAWAGRPTHPSDRYRSMEPRILAPLLQIESAAFFSLQKGPQPPQLESSGLPIIDLASEINDFADTAAALMSLDLLISVDTSVVHLAGALGRPVWTLLAFEPDWRWMLGRADSPWYPTMRLFRQPTPGEWEAVVDQVSDQLRQRLNCELKQRILPTG